MNPTLLTLLTGIAATGSATVGGVFYAFSTFVMPGLRALPPAEGTAAMQKINVAAVRPGLMIALFGTAAVCVAVGVGAVTGGLRPPPVALLAGSALYLVGTVGLTAGYHVPLNNALAQADASDPAHGRPVGRLPAPLDRRQPRPGGRVDRCRPPASSGR